MKVGKINWVSHKNFPISSVDAQPFGNRFITGGGDSYVRVWNLLPVISPEYEDMGQEEADKEENRVSREDVEESKMGDAEDAEMNESSDHESLSGEAKARHARRDEDFQKDIDLMKGLFTSEETRAQRLLAVLESHSAPVNCVRWNPLGTMFTSADDEGFIILWEYRGTSTISSFQQRLFGQSNDNDKFEDAKDQFKQKETPKKEPKQRIKEDWRALKTWRGHKRTISDLAWSPDSLHFVSCSTDATICVWNVNE